jgi:hypothetical protein
MRTKRTKILTIQISVARRELQRARCDGDIDAAERAERRMNALLDQLITLRAPEPAEELRAA